MSKTSMSSKKRNAKTMPKKFPKKRLVGYQSGRSNPSTTQNELKCFDVSQTNNTFQTTAAGGTFNLLNAVPLGSDLFQRVGRKIKMKSLRIRGCLIGTATASVGDGILRIIVYYDAQPNGQSPLITDLIQDSNNSAPTSVRSEMNMNNRARFQILRDYQMMAPTTVGGQFSFISDPIEHPIQFDMFIKLKGLEAMYNATNGGTISDITSGAIGLVCIQDTTVTAASLICAYTTRLRFYD